MKMRSAAVAVVWAAIAGLFIYKELTFKELIPILKDSAKSSAMILFIIASSTAFSWVFTFSGASQALVDTVVAMNLNSTLFCFVVSIILLIFGTFMEGTAIAVLLVPVLWPIAQSMGIDGRHCKGRDPIPDRICCSILPVRILKRFLHNAYLINLGN